MPLKTSKMQNATLINFAKETLTKLLGQLPPEHLRHFKLMYGRDNGKNSIEKACAMSIEEIVAQLPVDRFDWAITQCENSIRKIEKKAQALLNGNQG